MLGKIIIKMMRVLMYSTNKKGKRRYRKMMARMKVKAGVRLLMAEERVGEL